MEDMSLLYESPYRIGSRKATCWFSCERDSSGLRRCLQRRVLVGIEGHVPVVGRLTQGEGELVYIGHNLDRGLHLEVILEVLGNSP